MTTLFDRVADELRSEIGLPALAASGYCVAHDLGLDVVEGLRTGEAARLCGDHVIAVDERLPLRTRESAVARELGLFALLRADCPVSLEDAEEVGARLVLPTGDFAIYAVRETLPALFMRFPFVGYDLLGRRLATVLRLVVTTFRDGVMLRRFAPQGCRGETVDVATMDEYRAQERARLTPAGGRGLRGPGGAVAYAVREPGGADVVTTLPGLALRATAALRGRPRSLSSHG